MRKSLAKRRGVLGDQQLANFTGATRGAPGDSSRRTVLLEVPRCVRPTELRSNLFVVRGHDDDLRRIRVDPGVIATQNERGHKQEQQHEGN